MTSATPSATGFAYIDCDVPGEQTLTEWRRDRDAASGDQRRVGRSLRMPRLRRPKAPT